MSCDTKQRKVAQAAGATAGISKSGSKSAALAASAGGENNNQRPPKRPRLSKRALKAYQGLAASQKKELNAILTAALGQSPAAQQRQVEAAIENFGADAVTAHLTLAASRLKSGKKKAAYAKLQAALTTWQKRQQAPAPPAPPPRQIKLNKLFTTQDLDQMQTRALFSAAATQRQLTALRLNATRGHGHSDPRPQDWLTQDLENFRFLSRQLGAAHRNGGQLDTAALGEAELVDLWEFSQFEADRALRNLDHLHSGWSHLQGETATYLGDQHRLEARFYSHLAQQLAPHITLEMRDKYQVWEE